MIKSTWVADEYVWSTIYYNLIFPFRHDFRLDNGYKTRFTKWRKEPKIFLTRLFAKIFPKFFPNYYCDGHWENSLCVFGVGDVKELTNRKELLAHRFDSIKYPEAINLIEKYLHAKLCKEVKSNV